MDFSDIVKNDGKLYAVSQNGLIYLFLKKIKQDFEEISFVKEKKDDPDDQEYDVALTIYSLTESGFYFVKTVNILEEVYKMMEKKEVCRYLD